MEAIKLDCTNKAKDALLAAECQFMEADYPGALQDYQHVAASSPEKKGLVASKLQIHAETLVTKGKLLLAQDYLETGLALARSLNGQGLIASYLLHLGEMAYRVGDYAKARIYMEQAQPLLEQTSQPILTIRNMNNLGNTLSNLGHFAEAEKALDKALADATAKKDPAHIAQSLNNKGGLLYNLRRYADAMAVLEQAENHAIKAQNARLQLYAADTKGAVLRQQGDFARALQEYERALMIGNRYPSELQHEIGTSKRVIAELLIYSPHNDHAKNLALAEKHLKEVLVLHHENPIEMGLALSHLGEIALERKDATTAIGYFEQGLQNYLSLNYPDGVGRSHLNLGRAYNVGSNYQKALQALDKANEVYTRLADREWLRVGLYERGLAHERLGKTDTAERDYKASIDNLESIRGDVHGDQMAQELFTKVNASVYERLVSLLLEKGDIAGALEYIERSRLRALDEYLMRGRGGTDSGTPLGEERDKVAKEAQLLAKARKHREDAAESALVGGKEVSQLINAAAEDFQGRQAETARYSLDPALESINMTELPPSVAVITYFPTPKATYIIVARGGREAVAYPITGLDKNALREQVRAARIYLESGKELLGKDNLATGKTDTAGREILSALYKTFISPIDEAIRDVETLVIYPHDFLVFIPFEALISPQQQYLVENKRVVYLHAIKWESSLNALKTGQTPFDLQSAVVFADPQPLPSGQSPLPYAKNEAAAIKRYFPNSLILEGKQATERAFQEQWGKHEIVHIAAHGEASHNQAALFLAKGDDANTDGKLTSDDISGLDRASRKTKLVILSACETALDMGVTTVEPDDPVGSLGLAGMVHVFYRYHGVPSRIGSLWKVNDSKTAALMGNMYEYLGSQGKTKAPYDAFRTAQIVMIKQGGISSHPYFWSGFIYFGVPN